ncbi:MAG: HAMP domain-containing sensor histidine kinase [Vicinamibacterales bacterium]
MNFRAIRVRLTVWYLAILALGLGALGVGSWFGMRASLFHAIDHELEDRIQGVQKFMDEQIASLSLVEIRDEFREHSVLGPGGDLFQVCNQNGEWLYRSLPLENNRVPIRTPDQLGDASLQENLTVQNIPVRFASRRIVVRGEPYTVQVATPMHEFYEALEQFSTILLFSVPLLLLVASAGGYWISTRALRPVEEIRSTAKSISIRNLSERLTVPNSGDELQRLSETLNEMLARLSDSVQRMSQFTADASHELRAPVSLIRTTAELAIQQGRTNTEFTEDMKQVLTEAERTSHLIDSLLLLARADSSEDGLQKELTDWSLIVREAVTQVAGAAKEKKIQIDLHTPQTPVAVYGDAEALRRLAFILLDNSIKYSPESSAVTVAISNEHGQAICRVSDSGIGISAADQEHIFGRFWRADKVRSRGLGGAGLGLSIAKWIVDRHEGTLEVSSELGKGSNFEIRIPLHVTDSQEARK